MQKNLEDTNIEILAYCVMDNHVHILLYQKKSNK
ncbi:MAG: transposase [Clostridia bacterium]|nr:transposase [Clostridia bacterium]